MKALLRYAWMKGVRDRTIPTLVFGPSLLSVTPLLATAVFNSLRGREVWPMTIPGTVNAAQTGQILTLPALMAGAIFAGIAAFWIFRPEMMGRTIGLFLLAQPRMAVPFAATLFGSITGISSAAVSVSSIAFLTQTDMPFSALAAGAAVAMVLSAALGALSIGFSSQFTILFPAGALSVVAMATLFEHPTPLFAAAGIAVAVLITVTSGYVWSRRCPI